MATDERFDELIATWLQDTAPGQIPARVLDRTAERTRSTRQQVRWRGLLGSNRVSGSILAFGGTAAIVMAAVLVLNPRIGQPDVGTLPTTPEAWSRVSIDSRWATAQVDGLVAGPRGLLAILGELGSHDMQLSVSTDGRTWTLVPNDQFPSSDVLLPPQGGSHLPAVVTPRGFLFVADGNDVWASEDGSTWRRITDRARDEDLRAGQVRDVAVGGPGLVAVGSDEAWYTDDGSDWTLAEVPAPPTESFVARGFAPPTVGMQGVTVAGDALVAWGNAFATGARDATLVEPILWTSEDGRSWTNVDGVSGIARMEEVVAGPDGFVAIGAADATGNSGIWFSADGREWQPADGFQYDEGSSEETIELSIAAASSGYVAAGGEGVCYVEPCSDAVALIWTSPDGRSWSRLPSDDRFKVSDPETAPNHSGAWATSAVTWDSRFVVAGVYDASPAVWISGTPRATEVPIVSTPTPFSDPRTPFLGVWISTSDGDGGTQRMTVEPSADLTVDIVVTDTIATVCSGTSSTMTGNGSVDGDVLVIPAPDYRCDDGTDPQPMGGPGLNEELRNLTYARDVATDTLSVGIGDVWLREGADVPTPAPQPSEQAVEPARGSSPTWGPPGSGTPLGWSSDGTRILIQKDDQNLFIRYADGSETLVSELPSEYERFLGSTRPAGATISPDGSRVVFAGLTTTDGRSCHHGALFAVDADGGPLELVWESQAADDGGIVRYPTFSPDGTRIAFADGYCDSNHSVWVMNADGSDADQIVSSDVPPLGATHVHGLAWSADGDEIAIAVDDGRYTFAADGSGATQSAASEFCWPNEPC